MMEVGVRRENRKEYVDMIAAVLILQNIWTDSGCRQRTDRRIKLWKRLHFARRTGEAVEFFVLEQTRLGGVDYILVTDSEDDDAEALILKDVSAPEDEEAIYSIVDDDKEMDAVAAIFTDMLEDIELEKE